MGRRKKAAEPRSQSPKSKVTKRTRSSTARSTTKTRSHAPSPQAIRPSHSAKKQRTSSSSSGSGFSHPPDEYTPSSCTSPSAAAEVDSGVFEEASEDEDVDINDGVADFEEDSESDDCAHPAAKRRKTVPLNAPKPCKSTTTNRKVSTEAATGKAGKPDVIGGWKFKPGIDEKLPPMHDIGEIFEDITRKAMEELQFDKIIQYMGDEKLKVATMCSGTESPLLALRLVGDALKKIFGVELQIDHKFSAEIVPFKQAYIERNFHPKILFRDIRELGMDNVDVASTAYGAPVTVPPDVDILIAGFSCVDFSRLNHWGKELDQIGESGDTFRAILHYAQKHRPPIIVLENVNGAPWQKIKECWEEQEYAAHFVKLDTKHYYIPHTRQRVYMVCIDKKKLPSADASVKEWASLLKKFQRPASSSIDAFLLHEDDARVQVGREQLAKGSRGEDRGPRDVDWTKCQGRHQDYRASSLLGTKRPVTAWVDGGSCKMPDFAWIEWAEKQVERIWDTFDISYLRNAVRGFDSFYKTRVWELSQNIDRFVDTTPFGITGCITPTGQPFVTSRCGPLTGLEALSMQGLPIDQLILTRESQKQLQDLAGNAMTSTVVGPAILSALLVGYGALRKGSVETLSPPKQLSSDVEGLDDSALEISSLDLASCTQISVSELCQNALDSIRLCLCEGPTEITSRRLRVCEQCKHTACEKCAGIPSHSYQDLDQAVMQSRRPPHDFENTIKKALPMRLRLLGLNSKLWEKTRNLANGKIDPTVWDIYMKAVMSTCGQELRFHSTKRTDCWTIRFDGPQSRLELVLSDSKAQWYLYVKPDPKDPVNSKIRQLLKHPIARMVPDGNNLLEGPWKVRLPLTTSVPITINGRGKLTRSWESRLGLQAPEFADKKVWTALHIAVDSDLSERLNLDVAGEYKLMQQCGGASGSLHMRISEENEKKPLLYLFLDPEPIGNPKNDNFVFSTNVQRPTRRDTKSIVASVDPSWRPSGVLGPEIVECHVDGEWFHADATLQAFEHPEPATVAVPKANISFFISEGSSMGDPTVHLGNSRCSGATTAILSCKVPLAKEETLGWRLGPWMVVDETSERFVYASFSWLTEKVRDLGRFPSEWKLLKLPDSYVKCQECAPNPPDLKWRLAQAGQTSKIVPYEDLRQAGRYERAIKARAAPFVTYVRIDESMTGQFMVGLNVLTLAHRALAKFRDLASYEGVSLSWRLETQYLWKSHATLPRFTLKSNKDDSEASYVFPAKEKVYGVWKELHLRKEQQRSLQWMINQEAEGAEPFNEQEVEEANLRHLGWRAEVRATRSRKIRGGILADEVGYGKTATTLALIDVQAGTAAGSSQMPCVGRISLKATLIIVPRHLIPQWTRQITKFLGKKYKVVIISATPNLTSQTVNDFKQADIIVVPASLLIAESYLQKLSLFAALPEAPATAGRALNAWLARASERVGEHIEKLKAARSIKDFGRDLNARLAAAETDEELLRYVPSKRLRGKVYAAAAEMKGMKRMAQEQESDVLLEQSTDSLDPVPERGADAFGLKKAKSIGNISGPIFQMFNFNRIVIDEYTYVDAKSYALMTSLQATSRWVLSGTPPLDDFADVKTMAGFVGINLGVDDDAVGVLKSDNIRAIRRDRTAAELFQSYDKVHTPAWHEQRNKHAQSFLDRFARQNTAEIDEIVAKHELKAVTLPAAERAIFMELQQQLHAQDMKLREGSRARIDSDRTRRLNELLGTSKSAEEALLKCCSHFTLQAPQENENNVMVACAAIIEKRKEQYNDLCKELKYKLEDAASLRLHCGARHIHYARWKENVAANAFGDLKAKITLLKMIETAETDCKDTDEDDFYRAKPTRERPKKAQEEQKKPIQQPKARTTAAGEKTTESNEKLTRQHQLDSDNTKDKSEESGVKDCKTLEEDGKKDDNVQTLRDLAGRLRSLSGELVSRIRALRFFEAVRQVQLWQCDLGNGTCSPAPVCANCNQQASGPSDISVLVLCGHLACKTCLALTEGSGECVVEGCSAVAHKYHIIEAPQLVEEDSTTSSSSHYGKKLDEIIQLIKDIPPRDQVLLFVQFDDLMEKVSLALSDHGIDHYALTEKAARDAPKWMDDFQENKSVEKKKVLVLNPANESAAGANLTNANHVIFVSPLLARTQHHYDASFTQCIGRARRYGQEKVVYVHRFLALKTIDVDILQERSQKKLVKHHRTGEFELMNESAILDRGQRDTEWGSGFVPAVSYDKRDEE